nr:YggS family pyridoxal phosphate-dependent enzyme [Ahniella affigens]
MAAAGGSGKAQLLAVSKLQTTAAIREVYALGQRDFGENYVQEAAEKRQALADLDITWHLIGPLQSNKAAQAARLFDWVQSIDRAKIVPLLGHGRQGLPPLQVLIQVNVDDEQSKSGCVPDAIPGLADLIQQQPNLCLRGLMAIPAPADSAARQRAFRSMFEWYEQLRERYPTVDTLSMGMSDDFELAIHEGANLIRVGSALFGARKSA